MALVFPEQEAQALSSLGWQSVYKQLDYDQGFFVDRFFWDREKRKGVSPDSDRRLSSFPLICFSLNFEGDYLSLINIIQAENIPVRSTERSDWPLIMAGGPIAFLNPFPILPSLDFLYVGESEKSFLKTAEVLRDAWLSDETSRKALELISGHPGILIPGRSHKVTKQISIEGLRSLPCPAHSLFVSSRSVFRDSLLLEINRGCPYGCRFCAAGYIYRPPRQSRLEDLKDIVRDAGPRKVGLMGTALTDWPELRIFLSWLHARKIKFSLSSLRADGLDLEFLTFLRHCGTRTITLAVEGISRSIRTAMNKQFDEKNFFSAVELVSRLQFNTLKLYFILGMPGETLKDFDELEMFLHRLSQARKAGMGRRNSGLDLVSISTSILVPKPWTPLQWAPMDSKKGLIKKIGLFRKMCTKYKGLKFHAEKPSAARLQGLLARGDEKVHELLMMAADPDVGWKKALQRWSGRMEDYIDREFACDSEFVWDRIDVGVDRKYLAEEWNKYKEGLLSKPCPDQSCRHCRRCGMDKFLISDAWQ